MDRLSLSEKNQNTIEGLIKQYVGENNIHVVRRISGGGAVYLTKVI